MKLIALFLFLATVPCLARLGETEEQLIARYGKPTDIEYAGRAKQETFHKDNLRIEALFLDEKVVSHLYAREIGDDGKVPPPLTFLEAQEILKKESSGNDYLLWKQESGPTSTDICWKRVGFQAMFSTDCFTICKVDEWMEASHLLDEARKAKQAEAAKQEAQKKADEAKKGTSGL